MNSRHLKYSQDRSPSSFWDITLDVAGSFCYRLDYLHSYSFVFILTCIIKASVFTYSNEVALIL